MPQDDVPRTIVQRNAAPSPCVALWADCFTTYNEPHIGKAAISVLETLGYAVKLPTGGCCARPMISTGLLDQAIATADRTLTALRPFIDDPAIEAIVVLEPSCLSAIKDEWLKLTLKTDLPTRQRLADKAMLLEQFVDSRWESHPIRPTLHETPTASCNIIFHGHCHQKALWGADSSAAVLRRVAGGRVDVLPSGCCGMAGSFGFTADRYDLSMKIGELSLFPPIRAADARATIVAPGTSCRHQIKDGTGRKAVHPAEVLARALVGESWEQSRPHQ